MNDTYYHAQIKQIQVIIYEAATSNVSWQSAHEKSCLLKKNTGNNGSCCYHF